MKKEIEYTAAPDLIEKSIKRSIIIPNFLTTPEAVSELERVDIPRIKKSKKSTGIYRIIKTTSK